MKRVTLALAAASLLAACTSGPPVAHETPYIDREFGTDSRQSLAQQSAFPAGRYADRTPAGLQGITGEAIMSVLHETYTEEPQSVQVFQMGVTGGSGGK